MTLVDLPTVWWESEPSDPLLRILSGDRGTHRIDVGVYETHFNFDHELRADGLLKTEYPFDEYMFGGGTYRERLDVMMEQLKDESIPDSSFGVCDTWEQVIQKWPGIVSLDRNFIIGVAPIRRGDETARGGWRWHKWGDYIGNQEPTHEYIFDDTHIDLVFVFHIYEVYTR